MIETAVDGVVKNVPQVKVGVSGVTRDVSSGYCAVGGVLRQFFGKLTGISYFKIQFADVRYKTLTNGTYVTLANPTAFGVTTYNLSPSPCKLTVQENGYMNVEAGPGMTLYIRARIYCVFSNGTSVAINNLFKNSTSAIVISGTSSNERIGNGSVNVSLQVIGNYGSSSAPWSMSSLGSSNPYGITIMAQDLSGTITSIRATLESIAITVDGISYPMKLVL